MNVESHSNLPQSLHLTPRVHAFLEFTLKLVCRRNGKRERERERKRERERERERKDEEQSRRRRVKKSERKRKK